MKTNVNRCLHLKTEGAIQHQPWILEKIRELLIQTESGTINLPIRADKVARLRGVQKIQTTRMKAGGLLTPIRGGFEIDLNANLNKARANFVCAHEITHTFFYDLGYLTPRKLFADDLSLEDEEALCDFGARELLVPPWLLAKAIKNGERVSRLARIFNVPLGELRIQCLSTGLGFN